MARSGVRDPLDKFRWTVSIPGFSKLGFLQCGTPKYNITPREYAEGGAHLNPKIIVDRMSTIPVTFTRGVTNDTSFNKWATSCVDLVQNNAATKASESIFGSNPIGAITTSLENNGAESVPSNGAYPFNYRKDIKLSHVNRAGIVDVIYVLYNAVVISYQPASDFDATADDTVSIESITIAYEGFDTKYTGIGGFVGNIIAGNS